MFCTRDNFPQHDIYHKEINKSISSQNCINWVVKPMFHSEGVLVKPIDELTRRKYFRWHLVSTSQKIEMTTIVCLPNLVLYSKIHVQIWSTLGKTFSPFFLNFHTFPWNFLKFSKNNFWENRRKRWENDFLKIVPG